MPPDFMPFRCEVRPQREAVLVRPVGELDLETVPVVESQLRQLKTSGVKRVTLDLRRLCFLDSTGLRMILEWDALSRADGLSFSLIAGAPTVHRLFDLTRTRERLNFVDPTAARGAA